jgi:siroheme synthase-like protein
MLRLAAKRVLVVGAGPVAARKVEGLLAAGAVVTVVAPDVVPELGERAHRGEVVVMRRRYAPTDLDGCWLAVVATDDEATQRDVFADGEARGIWVNAADDPDHCSYILPAVVRRGPVVVAVSTGGASPALAQMLRDRMAGVLPAHLEGVADELARRRREVLAAGGSTESTDWKPLVQQLLDNPPAE